MSRGKIAPPPVCTGSGWNAVGLPQPCATSIPSFGLCGVCGQHVPVNGYGVCQTHPFTPARLRRSSGGRRARSQGGEPT